MSHRIPIHFDGVCLVHNLPVVDGWECDECKERIATNEELNRLLPDPFEEVHGG